MGDWLNRLALVHSDMDNTFTTSQKMELSEVSFQSLKSTIHLKTQTMINDLLTNSMKCILCSNMQDTKVDLQCMTFAMLNVP